MERDGWFERSVEYHVCLGVTPLSPPFYLHGMMEIEQGAGKRW